MCPSESKSEVQLATHEVEEFPTSRSIATESIDLPPSFQRHLSRSNSEAAVSTLPAENGERRAVRDSGRSGWEVISQGRLPQRAPVEDGRQVKVRNSRLGWEDVPTGASTKPLESRSRYEAAGKACKLVESFSFFVGGRCLSND